ncbi:uncharacterized protein LOC111241054 [Vigna radiata var. radiata]|uniref:Uncharacterized protein LOC111241054 n=1 Tax=Vigna radiata var. radiata TaxID=3916 RepID=A0A3Q0EMU3_VIGRR|nr:uncharacterized protein LOC111241054 [Vigna radiata var. radiata]
MAFSKWRASNFKDLCKTVRFFSTFFEQTVRLSTTCSLTRIKTPTPTSSDSHFSYLQEQVSQIKYFRVFTQIKQGNGTVFSQFQWRDAARGEVVNKHGGAIFQFLQMTLS